MLRYYSLLLVIVVTFVASSALHAQKKVLGKPESFNNPIDYFDNESRYYKFLREGTKNPSRENAWLVVSDRDKNPVYEKPTFASGQTSTINFGDYFYVLEEKEDWIHIASARVDELKVVDLQEVHGWVPKDKMLLWTSGLLDQNTKINKKAFLLNRADQIEAVLQMPDKDIVEIFRDPNSEVKDPPRKIFDYYFIFKKDTDRGMYLLSEEAVVTPINLKEKLIGWVSDRRISEWNTRICLEPNYDDSAFEERKNNPQFHVRAFDTQDNAQNYAMSVADESGVFWKDDPVRLPPKKLAESNPRRFKGNVVRFPMLSWTKFNQDLELYRSGVIGTIKIRKGNSRLTFESEIGEQDYAQIENYVDELDRKNNNVNFFFVVDGSSNMNIFQQKIVESIKSIDKGLTQGIPNVRYGALIYRDVPEEKVTTDGQTVNRLTSYEPLTPELSKITNFISAADFSSKVDRDDYSALYYGLYQSLQVAGFREDELNVVVLVGNYGDYKADRDRRAANQNHKTFFADIAPLYENLSNVNAHMYAIQLRNDGNRASRAFAKQGQVLIMEAAKVAYNQFYGNQNDPETTQLLNQLKSNYDITITEPSMAEPFEGNNIPLEGGRVPGRLILPQSGSFLSTAELTEAMQSVIRESLNFERELRDVMYEVFVKGNALDVDHISGELNIDAGRFGPAMADILNRMILKGGIENQDVYKSLDDKYKLYTEVFIPRKLSGAQYPTVSYVLFMPESDLLQYKNTIARSLGDIGTSYDKKRERLFEIYKELIVQFSGNTDLRKKRAEEFTRAEVMQMMQGIYAEGLQIEVPLDVRIGDIKDEKVISNIEIDELIQRFNQVNGNLENILRRNTDYDFCYTSDQANRYYWIPIDQAF